jgi:CRISPR system Cascade subunit CasA
LPLKGQPGGLAYKDWLGLVLGGEDKFNRTLPAKVVQEQIITGHRVREKTALWCFGYDMDNAKARCWYQHRLPIVMCTTEDAPFLVETIKLVVALASGGLSLLRQALKEACFNTPKEAKGDFSAVDIAYWQETEGYFRTLLPYLVQDPHRQLPQTCDALLRWSTALYEHIFGMFDAKTLANPDSAPELLRVLRARRRLDKEYNKQKVLKELKSLMVFGKEVQDA